MAPVFVKMRIVVARRVSQGYRPFTELKDYRIIRVGRHTDGHYRNPYRQTIKTIPAELRRSLPEGILRAPLPPSPSERRRAPWIVAQAGMLNYIIDLRMQSRLRQSDVAAAIGLERSCYTKLENQKRHIWFSDIRALARLYPHAADELLAMWLKYAATVSPEEAALLDELRASALAMSATNAARRATT